MKAKIKVKIYKKPEPRRKDSFWFDGHVATVTDGKTTVNIVATGHVDVCFNPNETNYDNDSARKEARKRGYTDRKINNLYNHDGVRNSNWYSFELISQGSTKWDSYTDVELDGAINYAKDLVTKLASIS